MVSMSKSCCAKSDQAKTKRAWRGRWGLAGLLVLLFSAAAFSRWSHSPTLRPWVTIPAGAYALPFGAEESIFETAGFRIQRTETTVAQFVRFLNRTRPTAIFDSPQISFERGRYRAQVSRRKPVAYVTYADAVAYADWRSQARRRPVRLPTAYEWELAARGLNHAIPYPWGWALPDDRAQFDTDYMTAVAQFAPNPLGLFDMAGNVAEWTLAADHSSDVTFAMGGSWAERDPDLITVNRRTPFMKTYRDADIGFRLIEPR